MSLAAPSPAIGDPLAELETAWREHLQSSRHAPVAEPRDYVYASRRRSCVRAMALDLLHPEDDGFFGDDTLERFAQGNAIEREVYARLMQIGPRCPTPFEVIEGQKHFSVFDRDGTKLITGRIDGRLWFRGTGDRPVFEIKSGDSVRRIETLEDFEYSPWTRHMPDQLLAYLLAESEPWGFFVLSSWGTVPRFVRVDLEEHLGRAEAFLRDARTAVDVRFDRAPTPEFTEDASECRRCPHFGKTCVPPLDYGEGLRVLADERLIRLAEVREENQAAAKEFERADRELKKRLRGVERGLLGPFSVTGKWGSLTKYEIPEEIKNEYRVVDEHGRFLLSIERLPE